MNPLIELFRGIGAFMVLNSHYANFLSADRGVLNFLWTGVHLFFVITGFVFAKTILYKEVDVLPYSVRRFFRIYPLYIFSLIIYYFIAQDHPKKLLLFLKHCCFLNTVTYSAGEAYFFNAAFWSLPVEIEFYAFVPVLAYLRKRTGVTFLLSLFPIFFIVKFLLALSSNPESPVPNTAYVLTHHLPGMMPEFSIGIILYLVYEKVLSRKQHLSNRHLLLILMSGMIVLSLLCAFFVAYGYGGINAWIATKAFFTTACAFGYALLLLSFLLFFDGKKVRVYALFLFLGSLSYGTYLLHGIFPHLADLLGIQVNKYIAYFSYTGIVLLLAFLCYRYIENPLRIQGRILAERVGRGNRSEVIQ